MNPNARTTDDYTPTVPGSRQYNQAVNARREMLNSFDDRMPHLARRRSASAALSQMTAAKKLA